MVTARKADVDMDSQHIGSTEWMQLAEVEQRERIEKDILQERLSRKQMVLSDQAPEASASYILSTGAIVGTMKVLFEPVGTQICILPREIVEANLQVNLEVGKGIPDVDSPKAVTPKKLQTLEGEANIQKSLGVVRKIIGRGDEVKCLRPIDLSWEENARESAFRTLRGLMQVPIAIYIRRDHQCLEIADAICRRCHLGADLWQSASLPSSVIHPLDFCTDPDPETEDCSTKLRWDDTDDVLAALSGELASSLVQVSRSITPPCSKQLADYTRSVRARVFRSLHLDFAWTYPKGIFDSLDTSCLMFDQERLLDIIDGRGSQASKYGITNSGPYGVAYERRSRSKESSPVHHSSKEKISAVNMFSETNYAESRQGKRTVEVRIDLIPSHVTDLVFVVSPTNSRDLSKFTDLQSMVIDAESSEVLASSSAEEQISPGHECAVMLSVYRLDDHLWHVNKIDSFGKGSHRDYRPVIAKVLSLGYPRQQAMKNLVPDVLKRIQAELSVPHPVKDTNVRVSRKNALEFGYAVELTGDQKMLSSEMLQRIADPMFIEALAETLYDSSSNRISKSHLTISEASYGEAWNLEFEFKYKFPEQEEDTEEDSTNCYLDATCVLFEGQALREVVDYRGAHGIRWVTNGVLDYRGYWVGQIPIGDASGGAVHHIGGSQNYAAREGKTTCQVELDKLPANVTDVFFVLSNHTTPVGAFSGVSLQVKDVNHPGHEVTGVYELAASDPKESALVACRCSRSPALETGLCEDTWTLDMMSISCGGHAMDYRPALQSLYAAQAATRNTRSVQWPCRGGNSPRGALQDRPYGLPAIKRPMNELPMLGVNSELPEGLARVRTPSRDESLPGLPPVSARNRQPDAAVPSAGYGKQGSPPQGDPEKMSLTPLPPLDSPKVLEARSGLQEVVGIGRRLCYIACAKLQCSDVAGAQAVLEEVDQLPGLGDAVGDLWQSPPRRLRLCESCNVAGFLEVYIQTLGLKSFLETGELLPEVAPQWKTGIPEFDNECYLLGAISSLRELERYAVNRGQSLDLRSVKFCLELAQTMEEALMQFNFRNSALRVRFDGVKYTVKKLESLVYEIDLARQRDPSAILTEEKVPAGDDLAPDPSSASDVRPALNLENLGIIKLGYDDFDERREQVMKQSRDVVKAAKNAIYALHRSDEKRADEQLQRCAQKANGIYASFAAASPTLRIGFFSGALEELAEALAYRAFRIDGKLLSMEEMQDISGLKFPLLLAEYLGGLMDLTGEVGRLAVRTASRGRPGKECIEDCLACVQAVYDSVSLLPFLPGSLGKKMSPLKGTLGKIEQVLYELALLSQGVSLKPSEDADE
ncbi:Tsnax [Symbiodinium necroappetens]|uniref:Tsnax protein n=1 Tax=Symbiodinium necroappetens TaxID=1628268 RepID=A0A813BS60_9DINO|nr:Tsnax [Symbiodinium necroappetens]